MPLTSPAAQEAETLAPLAYCIVFANGLGRAPGRRVDQRSELAARAPSTRLEMSNAATMLQHVSAAAATAAAVN